MKKEYSSPEFDLTLLRFESLLSTVLDSRSEGSGWDDDDDRED